MSSSRGPAALALLLSLALAGCGFRPLYGEAGLGEGVAPQLAEVEVGWIADRTGQMLRNELTQRLSPRGEPASPRYHLDVTLRRSVQDLAFRRDETPTLARLTLFADYRLVSGDKVVTSGTSRAVTSYSIPPEAYYAVIAAERDAERRAVVLLADEIRTRLAVFFADQPERAGGGP